MTNLRNTATTLTKSVNEMNDSVTELYRQQRWTLLKFYFVASYLVLIGELVRAALN